MKKLLLTFVFLVGIVFGLYAQKLTYQAVIRDNSQQLVTNAAVKATVTITFSTGNPYSEVVNGSTNVHGLLSFEFGDGTLNGRDWTGTTIAVKVVKADDESTVYVNDDARSVSAVPYALSVNGQSIQNYLNEHHYVDLDKLNDTLSAYSTTAVMDGRHYLTSDSAVITTMQSDISRNAAAIGNLTLHTAKAAIRDSVAGQIHDSIAANAHTHSNKALLDTYTQTEANLADAVAKKHEHANMTVLNATTAPYTDADSIKLKNIAEGAEVNVQADWNQSTTTADDYIKNKPTIPTVPTNVSAFNNDAGYLTNADVTTLLSAVYDKIDSLAHLVDSLSNLPHGGGGTPTVADGQPCPGTATVSDVDGNTYNTVKIGNQCWMKENLRTTTKRNNVGNVYTENTTAGYNAETYGYYYDWEAVMQNESGDKVQGICPTGWHVPTWAEYLQLTDYVNSQPIFCCYGESGKISKALASSEGWASVDRPDSECCIGNAPARNNWTRFSLMPAGYYHSGYRESGMEATIWSATDLGSMVHGLRLFYASDEIGETLCLREMGCSVRCLRDASIGGGDNPSAPAMMSCEQVMECMGDTLGKINTKIEAQGAGIETLNGTVTSQGQTIETLNSTVESQGNTIDSLAHLVDSLSNLPHGGGDEPATFTCGSSKVKDVDNNEYNTVAIGNQCWLKENLRTKTLQYGQVWTKTDVDSAIYGRYYDWQAAMQIEQGNSTSYTAGDKHRGICPAGWHVPSDAEWTQLTDYVSSQSEYVCGSTNTNIAKALASTTGWDSSTETCEVGNTPSSNNATGFSAVPAGFYYGSYYHFGSYAGFWSAAQNLSDGAYYRSLNSKYADVGRYNNSKDFGFSVRCLRDESGASATLPTVTTTSVANITQNSATSGGNVTADGGATVTARGVCWSTSQNPTTADSHTTDGSGTGNFTSSITGLQMGTTYYVRAYATNSVGTAYGNQVSFTTEVNYDGQPCPGAATVTDYDGNTYNTVQIGQQCWMKQNLKTTRYSDGTSIPLGNATSSDVAYRYCPDNNSSNVSTYGYLYNWPAVMRNSSSSSSNPSGVQGICPTGWHVPSDAEWTQLTDYVSSQSEYVCGSTNTNIAKALASTTGWNSSTYTCAVGNTPGENNATGFSAVPAGYYDGSYYNFGYNYDFGSDANFWSATQYDSYTAYSRGLYSPHANVARSYSGKGYGFSVRCLRD